ncbi:hypothetical protein U14_02310 [Candidatus Moduliflexus flocculans]|uniref:Uncharacterized protein n=1 Tax=Candidatus Moduliflexus flocculans TaxID=1499966 RepID=A0A0S6VYG9_9BACT|nr:hypothetical protein U14_02310 [Candidatus Moduliflexus flocculans]
MRDFDRKTGFRNRPFNALVNGLFIRARRENHLEAQFRQERIKKRKEFVIIQRAGNAKTHAAFHRFFWLIEADQHLFALRKQIGNQFAIFGFFLAVHVPTRAASAVMHRV